MALDETMDRHVTVPSHSWFGRVTRKLKPRSSTRNLRDDAMGDSGPVRAQPRKLQRKNAPQIEDRQVGVNELGEYEYSIFSEVSTLVPDRPLDHTEVLHGLADQDDADSLITATNNDWADAVNGEIVWPRSERHEQMVDNLPSSVWQLIASFLDPADAAYLAIATKKIHRKLGNEPLLALRDPENHRHLIRFLNHLDRKLPEHLICFPCGKYHLRLAPGHEKLKADYVNNPVFICPKVFSSYLPRTRLAHGRELPYAYIQLATRHARYGPRYGLSAESLCRKWRDPSSGWTHTTRYAVIDGHLLVRVRSEVFAAPKLTETALRHLLYERNEYWPYFSVCAHWRDGDLMPLCKCALSHIPEPPKGYLQQLRNQPMISRSAAHPNYLVRQCDWCRPARRCPECPTEYLIEVNLAEDKQDPINRFKHALVVTRWSDLGDGSSPWASAEFAALNGGLEGGGGKGVMGTREGYDSFSHVGRRAVAGVFESKLNGHIPPQRMISLNPQNKKKGIEGHGWY